jgi:hypothetical protein
LKLPEYPVKSIQSALKKLKSPSSRKEWPLLLVFAGIAKVVNTLMFLAQGPSLAPIIVPSTIRIHALLSKQSTFPSYHGRTRPVLSDLLNLSLSR